MKVFLSWSGQRSLAVATEFRAWLPRLIQECREIYISSETTKGDAWFSTITAALGSADIGILFLTPDNQDAPWLNFEGGALLTKFDKQRLIPVLVGFGKTDYSGPMKSLQLTEFDDKADMRLLLETVNDAISIPLEAAILDEEHELKWDAFITATHRRLAALGEATVAPRDDSTEARTVDDKISELLELVRDHQRTTMTLANVTQGLLDREALRSPSASKSRDSSHTQTVELGRKTVQTILSRYGHKVVTTGGPDGIPLTVYTLDHQELGVQIEGDPGAEKMGVVTYMTGKGAVSVADKDTVILAPF